MTITQDDPILTILKKGDINIQGEFLWGSNYTFSVQINYKDDTLPGVYKPTRGERPLWDFPRASLARREIAAYLVSEALGWNFVPPTVYRKEGPAGAGSVQLFIDHDPECNYFSITESKRQRLKPVALFDLVINNADRKGSHILFDAQDKLWLIDHGICFHKDHKLRTVIWDFAGESIPGDLCTALSDFRHRLVSDSALIAALSEQINQSEIDALARRIEGLLNSGSYPDPHPSRRPYPWPPV
ncbi:MAG TPA: SCO1664 family protein [Anaerolineales bacterium]